MNNRRRDYRDYRDYGSRDYRNSRDYRDYRRDYDYDERNYGNRDYNSYGLEEWKERLERQDKVHMTMEQLVSLARRENAKFDYYDESDLKLAYLMMSSDYMKKINISDPTMYLKLAIAFLEDEDTELKGKEKLMAYYDYIVKGE